METSEGRGDPWHICRLADIYRAAFLALPICLAALFGVSEASIPLPSTRVPVSAAITFTLSQWHSTDIAAAAACFSSARNYKDSFRILESSKIASFPPPPPGGAAEALGSHRAYQELLQQRFLLTFFTDIASRVTSAPFGLCTSRHFGPAACFFRGLLHLDYFQDGLMVYKTRRLLALLIPVRLNRAGVLNLLQRPGSPIELQRRRM